ncbi:hypothetical protein THASP1DRAFT_33836 [Thamnocephalis sphaerospora]|uniref:Inhibitor I9 domain-containing protein n=1 Tax=Thamnocephalis sphaerospora TaxID=78915 RepID=A0A4P9XFP4_9FUNG|nr:hypothetical protein THASP1DRAFT_33836 [Thamnocephalis sphaerospora]|eukprot:RKP04402.1 hypothetical protein THASP1DRAFT_33836 [Thamnocephalis sphaerospora]
MRFLLPLAIVALLQCALVSAAPADVGALGAPHSVDSAAFGTLTRRQEYPKYMVKFTDDSSVQDTISAFEKKGLHVVSNLEATGILIVTMPDALADELKQLPTVKFVEKDSEVELDE